MFVQRMIGKNGKVNRMKRKGFQHTISRSHRSRSVDTLFLSRHRHAHGATMLYALLVVSMAGVLDTHAPDSNTYSNTLPRPNTIPRYGLVMSGELGGETERSAERSRLNIG